MVHVLVRGGGDLATGVVVRLHRAGMRVIVTELPYPLAVRRTVTVSEAVHDGECVVEDVRARRVASLDEALAVVHRGIVAVMVAPDAPPVLPFPFYALVDARMSKHSEGTAITSAPFVIGLGPGFAAGTHCHAVVETKRGHTLGRVHWSGGALPDTARPDGDARRVLRAPVAGAVVAHADIGQHVDAGQLVCEVAGQPVASPLAGVLRGLIRPGTAVAEGVKIGDVDARDVQHHCYLVSDKALAVGGGVLEALLSRPEIRARLSD